MREIRRDDDLLKVRAQSPVRVVEIVLEDFLAVVDERVCHRVNAPNVVERVKEHHTDGNVELRRTNLFGSGCFAIHAVHVDSHPEHSERALQVLPRKRHAHLIRREQDCNHSRIDLCALRQAVEKALTEVVALQHLTEHAQHVHLSQPFVADGELREARSNRMPRMGRQGCVKESPLHVAHPHSITDPSAVETRRIAASEIGEMLRQPSVRFAKLLFADETVPNRSLRHQKVARHDKSPVSRALHAAIPQAVHER
mmetsp:Transcript_17651/g.57705  ORF Transcript_17651/g.57705 Transcript_17651/m.57705 type:complete len:255 (+) Transcript_17651:634-1398(+)